MLNLRDRRIDLDQSFGGVHSLAASRPAKAQFDDLLEVLRWLRHVWSLLSKRRVRLANLHCQSSSRQAPPRRL